MKESKLLKLIDLWSLGKVVLSASVLWFYTIGAYFNSRFRYNSLLELVQAHRDKKVCVILPPKEFIELLEELEVSPNELEEGEDKAE